MKKANHVNTWGVMDILDPLSKIFDVKETVTKDYHKPHPVDENILPKVEKNEELQNNKILFSDNDTSDYIKSEQVSVVNEETTWSVMAVLVPLIIYLRIEKLLQKTIINTIAFLLRKNQIP